MRGEESCNFVIPLFVYVLFIHSLIQSSLGFLRVLIDSIMVF